MTSAPTAIDAIATELLDWRGRHSDFMGKRKTEGRDERPGRRRRRRAAPAKAAESAPAMPPMPPAPPAHAVDESAALLDEMNRVDESLLTPEERAYLDARRTAEHKVALYREAVKLALFVVPMLIFIPVVGFIFLFFGGMKLGRKYYSLMIEPNLRRKLIEDEVSKRLTVGVHQERRELEGAHARSLEELSASIAHEIRNPITAAKSLVQQMEEEPSDPDNVEYARVALGELQRVERSISHLLKYAREEDVRMQPVHMADVLDSALETFRDRSARAGIALTRQFDTQGATRGDPEKLRRIFINLIGNGIDALVQSGTDSPAIDVNMGENLAGTEVWVRIVDNGPGIDAQTSQKIFNPFFTSKEGGTGLGLPITKKLVEAHDGRIEVHSEPGHGTEFVITFPKRASQGGPS